jgi:hypothetical protein
MDIGEERIGMFPPLPNAFLQTLDHRPVNPVIIHDVTAKGSIQQGDRNFCMRACLFRTASGVGRDTLDGVRETGLA